MTELAKKAASYIQRQSDLTPSIAIALGSGLGPLADEIENAQHIPYTDIPGFPQCSVSGHGNSLTIGKLLGHNVVCLQGRAHYYEGMDNSIPKTMVRTLRLLGAQTYLATNASGSLNAEVVPGNLVMLNDHINFQFNNPLVGPNDDDFGPRFIGLEQLYNKTLRQDFNTLAQELNIPFSEGVYMGVLGPCFETPAEIRAFRMLGADIVGMSTIPEVLCAHHCGMTVGAIAVVTNLAAGMADQVLSHDITLAGAKLGTDNLIRLIKAYLTKHKA